MILLRPVAVSVDQDHRRKEYASEMIVPAYSPEKEKWQLKI